MLFKIEFLSYYNFSHMQYVKNLILNIWKVLLYYLTCWNKLVHEDFEHYYVTFLVPIDQFG